MLVVCCAKPVGKFGSEFVSVPKFLPKELIGMTFLRDPENHKFMQSKIECKIIDRCALHRTTRILSSWSHWEKTRKKHAKFAQICAHLMPLSIHSKLKETKTLMSCHIPMLCLLLIVSFSLKLQCSGENVDDLFFAVSACFCV